MLGLLERDRVGVIDEESGDRKVGVVVDTSLEKCSTLTQAVFLALGVCPGL